MSTDLNSIYTSLIKDSNFINDYSIERAKKNSKDIGSALFATQLENAKKTDTFLNEIKNYAPKTTVTVKSMNSLDIQKYYEEWKKQPIDYSGLKHNIIVSPKVLEKMEKDPKYAEQMLQKIKKAAIPEGFGNATIYEYKVIVRDDGEIETLACADFMNEKKAKIEKDDENKKKGEKKKLELTYSLRRTDKQSESLTLSEKKVEAIQFIEPLYLFHAKISNKKIGNSNKIIL